MKCSKTICFLSLITILLLSLMACEELIEPDDNERVDKGEAGDSGIPLIDETYMPQSDLTIPITMILPEYILEVSNPYLWEALYQNSMEAAFSAYPITILIGLTIDMSESELMIQFDMENPNVYELLSGIDFNPETNPSGMYYGVSMTFIEPFDLGSPEGNIYMFEELNPQTIVDHKSSKDKGGCCAILAVAHSLVRRMGGLVDKDDAVEKKNGKEYWKPEFLKKVWKESGDTDGNRGLTDEEAEDAHKADWHDDWEAEQIDDDEELVDDDNVDCKELKKRYEALKKRLETNDDITMRIRGKDGKKGDEWGHRVLINGVTWHEGPDGCSMEIDCVNTGIQDPNDHDFENIPFNPGSDKYKISTDKSGKTTTTSSAFKGSTIKSLSYDSFDEEPK